MSSSSRVWLYGLLTISFTSTVFGDLAPQRFGPKQPMVAPVEIVEGKIDHADPNVVAKIVIPDSLLPDLQEPSYARPSVSNDFTFAGVIIVGFALTAISMALMVADDKKTRDWKMGVICVSGCALLGLMMRLSFLFPPKLNPPSGDSKAQPQILVEIQKGGHEVLLVLSRGK